MHTSSLIYLGEKFLWHGWCYLDILWVRHLRLRIHPDHWPKVAELKLSQFCLLNFLLPTLPQFNNSLTSPSLNLLFALESLMILNRLPPPPTPPHSDCFAEQFIIYDSINWLIREGTTPLRTELQLWGHLCFGCLTFLRLLIKMLLIFWAVKADSELSPCTLSLLFPDACCDCFLCPFCDLCFLFFSIRGWRTPQECGGLGITPSPSLLFTQALRHVHTGICKPLSARVGMKPPRCQNRHYFTWKKCFISTLLKPCQGKKNGSCDFSMPSGKLDWASASGCVSVVLKQASLGLNSWRSLRDLKGKRHFWGLPHWEECKELETLPPQPSLSPFGCAPPRESRTCSVPEHLPEVLAKPRLS